MFNGFPSSKRFRRPRASLSVPDGSLWLPPASANIGRFIRVDFTTNWGSDMTQFLYIWLCDIVGAKFNTEDMTHTASPDYACSGPTWVSKASNSVYWRTQALPGYWQVDLGVSRSIGMVKIQASENSTRALKDFTVSSSDDGVKFTQFMSKQAAQSLDLQTFSAF